MKLMVIDGNSIVNRAYYGIRPLSTRDGLYTHAIYGFLTTLQRLLDEEQPEALCVTFDRREPTFRHQADERYKAQRKGMPEELALQLPYLKQVLSAMNIPQYDLTGYEADDLIGTISRRCEAAGWDCVIVTGDKDSLQLITPHTKVKLVSTRMGQTTTKDMTEETFREQYGFTPHPHDRPEGPHGRRLRQHPRRPRRGGKDRHGTGAAVSFRGGAVPPAAGDRRQARRHQKSCRRAGRAPSTPGIWPPSSPMPR